MFGVRLQEGEADFGGAGAMALDARDLALERDGAFVGPHHEPHDVSDGDLRTFPAVDTYAGSGDVHHRAEVRRQPVRYEALCLTRRRTGLMGRGRRGGGAALPHITHVGRMVLPLEDARDFKSGEMAA